MEHGVLVQHNVVVVHKLEQKHAYLATNAVQDVQVHPLNPDIVEPLGVSYPFTIYEWCRVGAPRVECK